MTEEQMETEISYIKKAIDNLNNTFNAFLLKEEARLEKVSGLELTVALLEKECEGCKAGLRKDIDELKAKPKNNLALWSGWITIIVSITTLITLLAKVL